MFDRAVRISLQSQWRFDLHTPLCITYCLSILNWGQVGTMSASTDVGSRWLGRVCCEWIAPHIHRSFVDRGDKAGSHCMTGRPGLGNGGQDTAALRPRDSAESNEGHLSLRILPKAVEGGGVRWGEVTALKGKSPCSSRRRSWNKRYKFEGGFDSSCRNLTAVCTGTITQPPEWNAWNQQSALFCQNKYML